MVAMMGLTPWALLVLILVFVCGPLLWWHRERRRVAHRVAQGLAYIKNLRLLLTHMQQHRGLTTGYLSGNQDLGEDIALLGKRIARDIQDSQAVGNWLQPNAIWQNILDHWERLSAHFSNNDINQNLRQHNLLISNLMYLIDDLAEAHRLQRNVALTKEPEDWRDLLVIAETIGQARALGTGVAAKGICTSVQRIQLHHLCHQIEQHLQKPLPDLTQVGIRELLACIQQKVVLDRPGISAPEYFKLASSSLNLVLELFDSQINRLSLAGRAG